MDTVHARHRDLLDVLLLDAQVRPLDRHGDAAVHGAVAGHDLSGTMKERKQNFWRLKFDGIESAAGWIVLFIFLFLIISVVLFFHFGRYRLASPKSMSVIFHIHREIGTVSQDS